MSKKFARFLKTGSTLNLSKGFTPVLTVLIVVVVLAVGFVALKGKLMPGSVSYGPTTAPMVSPVPANKVDTTKSANIAPATQSAKPAPEAQVAAYISCPSYAGENSVAYPPFPATGPASLTSLLYAGGSVAVGNNDSLASYDWDFEGDGKWDTTVTQSGVQHVYNTAGTYTPKFRVRSVMGKVSATCVYPYSVSVDKGKATSDSITVNKTDITVNLSKANPNTSLMVQDNSAYSSTGYLYGDGFTVSLLKATGWHLAELTTDPNVSFDVTEKMGAIGESFRVHTVVPSSASNGTYKISGKLQYFQGGTWHDAGKVNLTANVTD